MTTNLSKSDLARLTRIANADLERRIAKVPKADAEIALAQAKAAQPWSALVSPTQQDFINLVRFGRVSLADLAKLLAEGKLTPREWAEAFKQVLNQTHAQAYALGRQRAGDLLPIGLDDALRGIAAADAESDFLLSFLEAIQEKDKRYFDEEGNLRTAAVARRSRMYTGALRGTANEALANALPVDAEIFWRLGAVEEHCSDCPEMAALNPFTKDTLFQKPGDNQTPCLYQCKCWLEYPNDDGDMLAGFKPVI